MSVKIVIKCLNLKLEIVVFIAAMAQILALLFKNQVKALVVHE